MNEVDKIMSEAEIAYFQEDDIEKVLNLTEKAIAIDSTDIRPLDLMGVALYETHHNEEAILCFDKILELENQNNDAKLKKGQVLTEIKRYNEAIAIFDELIENNTDRKDEAIIAKLTLCIESEDDDSYMETLKLCKEIIEKEDSKYLKDEIGFIESIYGLLKNK